MGGGGWMVRGGYRGSVEREDMVQGLNSAALWVKQDATNLVVFPAFGS